MIKIITLIFAFLSVLFSKLAASEQALQTQPIISGYQYQHSSKLLAQDRRYMVSLPERYHMSNRHYASLYVIDADFQFQHVSAVVKNLARMGKLPPLIVIGIANQGSDDYLKTTTWPDPKDEAFGGAGQFHAYLKQELVPLIDSQFRTKGQKALSGYSLGGLFTLYSMMQPDTPFNAFLAMSPSAWFDGNSLPGKLEPLLKQGKLTAPVFISLAREEGMGVDKVVEVFEQSAPAALKWQYKHYPEENHFTTALPALYDGLQFLAPDYAIDGTDMLAIGDYHQVLAHFKEQQKNWAGFRFEWLHAYQFAKYMFWSKQLDQVDGALQAISKQFPESLTGVTIQLANGFNKRKDFERVAQLLARVKADGETLPGWHKQMSVYYQAMNKPELARQHQQQALKLAQQYQLESWEVWELK
ncbi:alpha/beta hydrolase [Thalassomonas actiniarum]|uniref:Alpha/beta hydrolase n=1 Tax=Thalassomonas actiniarum TaxID=485447 RepID=A0AAE9YRQ4_9GAMM|nr:alpha/beta hydrolase-fold protein [Thalassomonas actiniarum]WDD99059.1 alpha/beta hydrolase [Thalassomonas actiniarum]